MCRHCTLTALTWTNKKCLNLFLQCTAQLAKLKLEVSKCKDKRAKASLSGQIALLQDQLDTLVDNATNADASAANGNESNSGNAKVSKARRKREEKAKVDAERQRAIEKETAEASKNSTRRIERDRLTALLAERNLRLFEIEPNGHCLYASVIHQFTMKRSSSTEIDARLSVAESGQLDVRTFRSACASYMLDHADDFMPFVETDDGEPCDTERFEAYCARIVDEPVWATHLEVSSLFSPFFSPTQLD